MKLNKEILHAHWLSEMSQFTWKYMSSVSRKNSEAMIWGIQEHENDFIMEMRGSFQLPPKAAQLVLEMALFCKTTPVPPDRIVGAEASLDEIPEPMFCLQSLLIAAFPKNIETDCFKGHDCSIALGEPSEDGSFRARHCAFGGLGIDLMTKCRRIIDPLAPDGDIIKKADGLYLSIID